MRKTKKCVILTEDVINPKPDRRVKCDWQKIPIIKAGEKFIVETSDFSELFDNSDVKNVKCNFFYMESFSSYPKKARVDTKNGEIISSSSILAERLWKCFKDAQELTPEQRVKKILSNYSFDDPYQLIANMLDNNVINEKHIQTNAYKD